MGATASWLRAQRVALGVVLALLLLYTLVGFQLVPRLVRHALIGYAQRDLQRHLTIGTITFNPFTFTAQIRQLALSEADDAPIASFALLRISASASSSVVHRAWSLSEVRLERPNLNALIDRSGALNLARLAPPHAGPAPQPAAAPSLPALRIALFAVHQGQIHFEDRSRDQPFTATLIPIEFSLTDFRTQPSFDNRYHFSAATSAGERLDWSGEFTLQPLGSNGQFTVAALKASTIAAYLGDALPFALRSGSLDVLGQYQFVASGESDLTLKLPSLKLHQLTIAPRSAAGTEAAASAADTTDAWIQLPELDITNTSISPTQRRMAIAEMTLQSPVLQVFRFPDGSLNLQRLMGAPSNATAANASASAGAVPASSAAAGGAGAAGAVTAAPAPAWTIELAQLKVDGASVAVEDRSVSPVFKLSIAPLSLRLQNYSSLGTKPVLFTLDAGLGQSGHLKSEGSVMLGTLDATVDTELQGIDLPALQPYVAQTSELTINSGRLSAKSHVVYVATPARGQPKLKLSGELEVANFATRDNTLKEKFVNWDMLQVSGLRYQLAPDALDIQQVRTRGAYGRVIIGADGSLNITDILRAHAAGTPSKVAAAGPGPSVVVAAAPKKEAHKAAAATTAVTTSAPLAMPARIRRIDIEDAAANFTDHSVQPAFSSAILGLSGSVVGLSSDPASRAQVSLMGSVDRYAPVSITGQVNVLSAATYTDLTMQFRNIELTTFNPYSGKFAGYNIEQGKLTTEMSYHVENRKLDAKHHVVIDQLEFGAATESKQAVPLPIKLAVALLKDRNGVIDLNLPVTGSLDDPTFSIWPIVWQVFRNLIVKAVTAPFKLLGSLFGGGADLSYVEFPAGSAMLSSADTTKLNQLASALVERPQLKLDIPLHVTSSGDDAVLARAALERAVAAVQAGGAAPAAAVQAGEAAPATAVATPAAMAAQVKSLAAVFHQQFQADPIYPQPQPSGDGSPAPPAGGKKQSSLDDAARIAWLEQQLLPKFAPTQGRRDALARARAEAAQGVVLSNQQVQPERVFLTERDSAGGSDSVAHMELKLQ